MGKIQPTSTPPPLPRPIMKLSLLSARSVDAVLMSTCYAGSDEVLLQGYCRTRLMNRLL
jgi:hypothetical protein